MYLDPLHRILPNGSQLLQTKVQYDIIFAVNT